METLSVTYVTLLSNTTEIAKYTNWYIFYIFA